MPPDKCILNPDLECIGKAKATKVEEKLDELVRDNRRSHERFGERLDELERNDAARRERDERVMEKLNDLGDDIKEVAEDSKTIIRQMPVFDQRLRTLEELDDDVDKLKGKSGETWESIKKQSLGWVVALILAIVAAALGLGKYL